MAEVDQKDSISKQLKSTLDTVRRILDERILAFEKLNFSHKCLLKAVDQQVPQIRSDID